MREIIVINPAAGGGIAGGGIAGGGIAGGGIAGGGRPEITVSDERVENPSETIYYTSAQGDCRRYIKEECHADPHTHFTLLGGDGTINEAVCGIMDANAGETATFTIRPVGSGNDTIKSLPTEPVGKVIPLDLIRVNDSYSINMINIGFDCNVVASAARFKKIRLFGRTFAYIMGIITEFFKPFGEDFHIQAQCVDGTEFEFEGACLLCAVCNGQWCGGGFHNSPPSDMSDGVLEMLLVKKTGRFNFLKLIGKYKDGTLLDPETGLPPKGYEDIVVFRRIKAITVTGTKQICMDGELLPASAAKISVLPDAIRYRL